MNKQEIKDYYDNFGEKQDWQGFYENKAIENLIKNSDLQNATSIFEFGCGTGKFAKDLLENHLPENCKYLGIDLSETMCSIASDRLKSFNLQAKIQLVDGAIKFQLPDNSFDRFVSNYVLDILSFDEIEQVFSEAARILQNDGLMSLTSLTCGEGFVSEGISNVWSRIQKSYPKLVGGCRPLDLLEFVKRDIWEIKYHQKVVSFGITSEVLVMSFN